MTLAAMNVITIGGLISERRRIGDDYEAASKAADALKKERDSIDALLMEEMELQGVKRTSIDGVGTATRGERENIVVDGWDAFQEYIIDTKQAHLLQRRVMGSAVIELLEAGEEVPGVMRDKTPTLSFRRT